MGLRRGNAGFDAAVISSRAVVVIMQMQEQRQKQSLWERWCKLWRWGF
jgi:hypothetical protein